MVCLHWTVFFINHYRSNLVLYVQDDIFEVCLKKSLYRPVKRIEADGGEDLNRFEERNSQMPPLGSRVKRGRDWVWDDQDSLGPGTVIGHCKNSK